MMQLGKKCTGACFGSRINGAIAEYRIIGKRIVSFHGGYIGKDPKVTRGY
jgi:hypothetical protein